VWFSVISFCLQDLCGPPQAVSDMMNTYVCLVLVKASDRLYHSQGRFFITGRVQGNSLSRTCSTSRTVPSLSVVHCCSYLHVSVMLLGYTVCCLGSGTIESARALDTAQSCSSSILLVLERLFCYNTVHSALK
jgi:hypothetical protein